MPIEKLKYNNFDALLETCYDIYINVWKQNPMFNSKNINRDTTLENNKENSFWGIVEGHNDSVVFEHLERYTTIPFFEYIMLHMNISGNGETDDIIWSTLRRNINIISKKYNYLIVLSERRDSCFLVTAYPISENKKNKKIAAWKSEQKYNKNRNRQI